MPRPKTAAARLLLLLPWLNGDLDTDVYSSRHEDVWTHTDYPKVRRATTEFVQSFDGSAGAGHFEVSQDAALTTVNRRMKEPTDAELRELGATLQILLEQGFGDETLAELSFPAVSLLFAVRTAGRLKPSWRNSVNGKRVLDGGAKALRDYRAAGAYVVRVRGAITELVPLLVAHLLTLPDMVAVLRCQGPGCSRFLVTDLGARGRPRMFCSRSCGMARAEQG